MQNWLIHDSHSLTYRSPFGAVPCGTAVNIVLAVAGNRAPDAVQLCLMGHSDGPRYVSMTPETCPDGSCRFRTTVTALPEPGWLWYYFVIGMPGAKLYYGNSKAVLGGLGETSFEPPPPWQITVYQAGSDTPAWFRESIMYQIFVDRFCNGNEDGRVENAPPGSVIHAHWDNNPVYVRDIKDGSILSYDFFGGNLAGVMAKLPYLKELGVGVIYFNPIFRAPSNHKYDTGDYKTIDPMFGTNELFRELCAKAKEMGMAVMLDGVFSHTGSDSLYFNREGTYPTVGAYQSQDSPYYSWYRFSHWPHQYESWWGIGTLPNVEELDESYQRFIIDGPDSVVRQWAALGAKGWRLDVADELPDAFIQRLRRTMKEIDGESVLLGEVWEDASRKESYGILRPYLQGSELDSVMNYPFRRAVLDFFLGRADAAATAHTLMSLYENYPRHHFYACMNLLGSHDVPRILTLLGDEEDVASLSAGQLATRRLDKKARDRARLRLQAASLWQMTFPGVPCIYYGDEAGVEGYTDPLNRRTYPWGHEDGELLAWYKKLTALRTRHDVLRTGDWQPLEADAHVLAYRRQIAGGKDVFGQPRQDNLAIVLINRSAEAVAVTVDTGCRREGPLLLHDMMNGEAETACGDGTLSLTLPPYGAKLLLEKLYGAPKTCGVLLHPTSLPSPYGIGDFGSGARQFIDYLASAGQELWQILPLQPPGHGDSPYMALSAFAGNHLLLSPEEVAKAGYIEPADITAAAGKFGMTDGAEPIDFPAVKAFKEAVLRQAYAAFCRQEKPADYMSFCETNRYWLDDYALFMAAGSHFGGLPWTEWETGLATRQPAALEKWRLKLAEDIDYHIFLQYLFECQWRQLKNYATDRGIRIVGDLPIFVAHNSSDVWAHSRFFALDRAGDPLLVAGVPPDYFSKTGQLWGNPLYDWDAMAADGYTWWLERFAHLLRQVDVIRIDHFRGFEAYWEIEAGEETAVNGRWVKGPGEALFRALRQHLGSLPLIAEDLGVITDEVIRLRQAVGVPGMKVLHFCFKSSEDGSYPPLGVDDDSVVYTGTHDNNTTVGWYVEDLSPDLQETVTAYLGLENHATSEQLCWRLIELAYMGKGRTVIVPIQDILHLDSSSRMNKPGTLAAANWAWRLAAGMLTEASAKRLRQLALRYGACSGPAGAPV